jgi:uracil-DNA glycosylase
MLHDLFGLDTYFEVYFTNAIKCDPGKDKPLETKHLKPCTRQWLREEFALLDEVVPTVPVLIAGTQAFRSLKFICPEIGLTLESLQAHRRTNHLRLWQHPLVFTANPAAIARSVARIEESVTNSRDGRRQNVESVVPLPVLPGSPLWMFGRDLMWLKDVL